MIEMAEELARGLGLEATSNGDRLAVGGNSWLTLLVEHRADERFVWALLIRTSSSNFAGDRTDLHRHLAVLAAIVLRAELSYSTSLYDEPNEFSMVEGEIYQCFLVPEQPQPQVDIAQLEELLQVYVHIHRVVRRLYRRREDKVAVHDGKRLRRLVAKVQAATGKSRAEADFLRYRRRPFDWICIIDPEDEVSFTKSRVLCELLAGLTKPSDDPIGGVAHLIYPRDRGVATALPLKPAHLHERQIRRLEGEHHGVSIRTLPLENIAVTYGRKYCIIWRCGDAGRKTFDIAERELRRRHQHEVQVLNRHVTFSWKEPIDPRGFEKLAEALLWRDPRTAAVRLMGNINEPDGARDLICDLFVTTDSPPIRVGDGIYDVPARKVRVVVQCKVAKAPLNDSQLNRSIHDVIDDAAAEGFILVVSNRLTNPLWDRLDRLSRKLPLLEVWELADLERRLQSNPDILERFDHLVTANV